MSETAKPLDTREMSRLSSTLNNPSLQHHLMGIEIGSLQRIADSLEKHQTQCPNQQMINLQNQRITELGSILDTLSKAISIAIDRDSEILRGMNNRFEVIENELGIRKVPRCGGCYAESGNQNERGEIVCSECMKLEDELNALIEHQAEGSGRDEREPAQSSESEPSEPSELEGDRPDHHDLGSPQGH